MLDDPQNASIVRTIIGVESTLQRDALLALGCHHFQGYLFGKPMPIPVAAACATDNIQAGV